MLSKFKALEAPNSMLARSSLTHLSGDMKGYQLSLKDLYGKSELK